MQDSNTILLHAIYIYTFSTYTLLFPFFSCKTPLSKFQAKKTYV